MTDSMVCMTVAEMPRPAVPSTERSCALCGKPVWVDDKLLALPMRLLCVKCAGDPKSWRR